MISIQYHPNVDFVINFNFVVYDYDPDRRLYKHPVCYVTHYHLLYPTQETIKEMSLELMSYWPEVLSNAVRYPEEFFVHPILPPVVDRNDEDMLLDDLVDLYKASNPFSNRMTITVNILEKYLGR